MSEYLKGVGEAILPAKFRQRTAVVGKALLKSGKKITAELKHNGENLMNITKTEIGEVVKLSLEKPGVDKFAIGLEWNVKEGLSADCDIAAVLCTADGAAIGGPEVSMVSYATQESTFEGCFFYGDNRTGDDSETATPSNKDEQIDFDLAALPAGCEMIRIFASTYSKAEALPFGRVAQPEVTLFDNTQGEAPVGLFTTELDEEVSTATCAEVARLYKKGGEWRYKSMTEVMGKDPKGLKAFSNVFGWAQFEEM